MRLFRPGLELPGDLLGRYPRQINTDSCPEMACIDAATWRTFVTTDRVLVTGAFGLVGSAVVAALADQGRRVVATDLDVPANRKRAQALPRGPVSRCGGPI